MIVHHSSDAQNCGLSKAVQNCIIYIYYFGQMQCVSHKKSVNTWHNVSLQISLINNRTTALQGTAA